MPEDTYPQDTTPRQNDTQEETLHKILKILDEAKTGTTPLHVTTTSP
jgi:hypothetical protein